MEKPRYIVDENGTRTEVVLSYSEYLEMLELLEDLEDRAVIAERKDDPLIPHAEVVKQLKEDGVLSD